MPGEKAKESAWSTFVKNEDWMTVWLGFLIILLVLLGLGFKTPTFRWMGDGAFQAVVAENAPAVDSLVKAAQEKNEADLAATATALKTAMGGQDRKAIGDAAKKLGTAAVQDAGLKKKAAGLSGKLSRDAGASLGKVFSADNIWTSILIGVGFLILAGVGNALMGRSVGKFIVGFPAVFVLTWLSIFIAGNTAVTYYGLEFALWALVLGLIISNFLGLPAWMKEAVRTEYYIKVGLVIMGTGILFGEILTAGAYGAPLQRSLHLSFHLDVGAAVGVALDLGAGGANAALVAAPGDDDRDAAVEDALGQGRQVLGVDGEVHLLHQRLSFRHGRFSLGDHGGSPLR